MTKSKTKESGRSPLDKDPLVKLMEELDNAKPTKKKPKFHWGRSIVPASDLRCIESRRISTGNFGLDNATFGGIPKGSIARVYGAERSCKTGTCYNIVSEWQKNCGLCFVKDCDCDPDKRRPASALWVDAEGKTAKSDNRQRMVDHGIDFNYFAITTPVGADESVDTITDAIRAGVGLIVLDSLAHVVPSSELNKSVINPEKVAYRARAINRAVTKWIAAINSVNYGGDFKPTVVCVNQERTAGLGGAFTYNKQTGGKAADYATSLDIRLSSGNKDKGWFLTSKAGNPIYTTDWNKVIAEVGKNNKIKLNNITPSFINVHYKITASTHCPPEREGTFRYWISNKDGHTNGDVDNVELLLSYAEAYQWLKKVKNKYVLELDKGIADKFGYPESVIATTSSKKEMVSVVRGDDVITEKLWQSLIDLLRNANI